MRLESGGGEGEAEEDERERQAGSTRQKATTMDSYYSGSEGEDYDLEADFSDEEKTYELGCSLGVKVKAYFESSSAGRGGKRAKGAAIDKEFLKKLSLLTQGLPKETGVVLCAVGTEGTYKALYTALENGLILRWRCKGNKSDLTGVLKGHKGMVTSVLIYSNKSVNLPYMVFSGSADSSIKLWDPKSNQRVREGFITEGVCVQVGAHTHSHFPTAPPYLFFMFSRRIKIMPQRERSD